MIYWLEGIIENNNLHVIPYVWLKYEVYYPAGFDYNQTCGDM